MRIVIDMQEAQLRYPSDPISQFSMLLVKSMIKNNHNHQIIIVLNNNFPESISFMRHFFSSLIPKESLLVWVCLTPSMQDEKNKLDVIKINEYLRESFILSLQPDVLFMSHFFEGYNNQRIVSLNKFDHTIPVFSIIFGDLSLYSNDNYSHLLPFTKFYSSKFKKINYQEIILMILEEVRSEIVNSLDISETSVIKVPESDYFFTRIKNNQLNELLESSAMEDLAQQILDKMSHHGQSFNKKTKILPSDILNQLLDHIIEIEKNDQNLELLSSIVSKNFKPHYRGKYIYVDISELILNDRKTGIQRVVRSILEKLFELCPQGYSIIPIYTEKPEQPFMVAPDFESNGSTTVNKYYVDFYGGDVFLGLDLNFEAMICKKHFFKDLSNRGIKTVIILYDLLPIIIPNFFPSDLSLLFNEWLKSVIYFDEILCISRSVYDDLMEWFAKQSIDIASQNLSAKWFHLGADFSIRQSKQINIRERSLFLDKIKNKVSFLMVGTIEPRKGHQQALEAFEILWNKGHDIQLVIVGKYGWGSEEVIKNIKNKLKTERKIYYFEQVNDSNLALIYESSSCLLQLSKAEGFGLPLIEAAYYEIPLLLRDIPVFREIAGDNAFYFSGNHAEDLTCAIEQWLNHYKNQTIPQSKFIDYMTWTESTQMLLSLMVK